MYEEEITKLLKRKDYRKALLRFCDYVDYFPSREAVIDAARDIQDTVNRKEQSAKRP